jgi:hypothetical protein
VADALEAGIVPAPKIKPSLLQAILQALRTPSPETARAGAEELSQVLPEGLMPHEGLAEDRRRKAMIDAQLQAAQQ